MFTTNRETPNAYRGLWRAFSQLISILWLKIFRWVERDLENGRLPWIVPWDMAGPLWRKQWRGSIHGI